MDEEQNRFHSVFSKVKNLGLVKWNNKENIGISIFREYPTNIKFIPVKNQKGDLDSMCLVRIGYYHQDKITSDKIIKAPLHISVGLTSPYKSKHHWYDYSDNNSPSEEDVKKSELSSQPYSLDDFDRFEYHVNKSKIYDKIKNKYVTPNELVNYFFNLHLSTLTNFLFLLKIKLKDLILKIIKPSDTILKKINENLFGKKIKEDIEFLVGELKPYKWDDLEDSTTTSEKMKILGSDIPITYQSVKTFIIFVLIIYLSNYYFQVDFFGLYDLFTFANSHAMFSASLLIAFLLLIDRLIPYIILYIINIFIKIRSYLMFVKIKI